MATGPSTAPRRPLHRRPRVLLAGIAAGIVLGLGMSVIGAGGPEAWLAGRAGYSQRPVPPYEPRGRLVTVDDRGVYLDCRGPDEPPPARQATVLLEAGFGSGAASWGEVFDGVAAFARVCAWDRPGLGRSEGRGRHTPAEALDDLWRALAASGEDGPLVVAGHSFGGVYARILAAEHPDAVLGLLMIDAYYPDIGIEADASLPADFRERFRASLAGTAAMLAAGEDLDWDRTLDELRRATPFDGPAILLSIDPGARPFDADPAAQAVILEAFQASLRAMFPEGRLEVVPGSGHLIQYDRPEVVIERIRELLGRATATDLARSPPSGNRT